MLRERPSARSPGSQNRSFVLLSERSMVSEWRWDSQTIVSYQWITGGRTLPALDTGKLHSLFANRECRMKTMALKPQDVYVVLKLVAAGPRRVPYSHLA